MIRILQVLGGLERGGAETMIMNLYRNIDRTQIQFDFIIHTEKHQAYYDEIINLGGNIYSFPQFKGLNILQVKKNWNDFFKEHKEYSVLHSHVRSYASIYIPIAKKYGLKTIIHSHSTSNGRGVISLVKQVLQYPLRYQADFFMGCSKDAGAWLFGKKVVNSNRYIILQNAIDTKKFDFNIATRTKYREEFQLRDNLVFIHVGRLHPSKNHLFLLELFAEIHRMNLNTKLLIVGDGELRKEIETKIYSLSISDSVILTGSRSDIAQLLMAADCFLFPSNWEGLPVTVVEAQASGLPCLISDNVTREVDVSPLVKYIPINNGVMPWIKEINKLNFERKNVLKEICNSGFDINTTAKWLTNFYEDI